MSETKFTPLNWQSKDGIETAEMHGLVYQAKMGLFNWKLRIFPPKGNVIECRECAAFSYCKEDAESLADAIQKAIDEAAAGERFSNLKYTVYKNMTSGMGKEDIETQLTQSRDLVRRLEKSVKLALTVEKANHKRLTQDNLTKGGWVSTADDKLLLISSARIKELQAILDAARQEGEKG